MQCIWLLVKREKKTGWRHKGRRFQWNERTGNTLEACRRHLCVWVWEWAWVHLPPHSVRTDKRGVTVSVHHAKVSWLKRRLWATIGRSLLSPATLHSGADACLGTETRVREGAAGLESHSQSEASQRGASDPTLLQNKLPHISLAH